MELETYKAFLIGVIDKFSKSKKEEMNKILTRFENNDIVTSQEANDLKENYLILGSAYATCEALISIIKNESNVLEHYSVKH